MDFVEELFLAEGWSDNDDPMLRMAGEAVVQASSFLRSLYMADVWMQPPAARAAAEHGLRFLRRYEALAKLAFDSGRTLWVVQPKLHAHHHISLYLLLGSEKGPVLNPMCFSTQASEDFIGRPSRLSRRVTAARLCSDRVIDRYLRSCFHEWVKAGYIIEARG